MRFGYIWILLKDHLLSPGRRDGKGSEKFNLNLPVPPPQALQYSDSPPPPFTGSQIFMVTLLYTLSATTYPATPSPLGNHVIPQILRPPPPFVGDEQYQVPLLGGGELRVQGEGVEGIEEKFIFCHVSNFRYFQLKIKMPFVYVTLYVCPIIQEKYTFLFSYTSQCQLSVVSLLRRLTDIIKEMITTNNFVNLQKQIVRYTAISIYVVGSKPQAYNPESLKLILIYPYRLSVLSRTLEALIRQRKLKQLYTAGQTVSRQSDEFLKKAYYIPSDSVKEKQLHRLKILDI